MTFAIFVGKTTTFFQLYACVRYMEINGLFFHFHYFFHFHMGPSWSWSYGTMIYNYLCN